MPECSLFTQKLENLDGGKSMVMKLAQWPEMGATLAASDFCRHHHTRAGQGSSRQNKLFLRRTWQGAIFNSDLDKKICQMTTITPLSLKSWTWLRFPPSRDLIIEGIPHGIYLFMRSSTDFGVARQANYSNQSFVLVVINGCASGSWLSFTAVACCDWKILRWRIFCTLVILN